MRVSIVRLPRCSTCSRWLARSCPEIRNGSANKAVSAALDALDNGRVQAVSKMREVPRGCYSQQGAGVLTPFSFRVRLLQGVPSLALSFV